MMTLSPANSRAGPESKKKRIPHLADKTDPIQPTTPSCNSVLQQKQLFIIMDFFFSFLILAIFPLLFTPSFAFNPYLKSLPFVWPKGAEGWGRGKSKHSNHAEVPYISSKYLVQNRAPSNCIIDWWIGRRYGAGKQRCHSCTCRDDRGSVMCYSQVGILHTL